MATQKGGSASLDDLAEPDYDFSYFDNDDDDSLKKTNGKKKGGKDSNEAGPPSVSSEPPYILGTLIVRVVAARDLKAADNYHNGGGGLGDFLFGGGSGSANPYASVKFGSSVQRTTNLYDTLDPVWPRQETMYMDVGLPLSKTTHPDPFTSPQTSSPVLGGDEDGVSTSQSESSSSDSGDNGHANSARPTSPRTNYHVDNTDMLDVPKPILTVGVFSATHSGKSHKSVYEGSSKSNQSMSGDSDDDFLGMASVDLTPLFTGKVPSVDSWLPLAGGSGSIRLVCEYETTDIAPAVGDMVRFTRFCHPADLYPLVAGRIYPVQEVVNKDYVVLSYTSTEGWVCSFMVHRFMVLCVERHHDAVVACRDEFISITDRIKQSPLVDTVAETVEKLPEEGIFAVGAHVFQGGAGLLGRWLEGGLDTAVKDVAFATNWDGQYDRREQQRQRRLAEHNNNDIPRNSGQRRNSNEESDSKPSAGAKKPPTRSTDDSATAKNILPNMPTCPITSEPMADPVVAADGHTYERSAIARWLQSSNKSPLTGSVLPHKELVPNYGLLSSLQEQADAVKLKEQLPTPSNDITSSINSSSTKSAILSRRDSEALSIEAEIETVDSSARQPIKKDPDI